MYTDSLSASRRRDASRSRSGSRSPANTRSPSGTRTPPGLPPGRSGRQTGRQTGRSNSRDMRDSTPEQTSGGLLSTAFLSGLFGLCVAAGLGIVLVLIMSVIAGANPDPDALTGPLGLAALAVSALAGGFAAARHGRRAGLLCGLFSGALTVLLVMTGNLCFPDGTRAALTLGLAPEVKAGLYAVVVILSAVGGLVGRRRR